MKRVRLGRKGKLAVLAAAGIGAAYYLWDKQRSENKGTELGATPDFVTVHPPEEKPAGDPAEDKTQEPAEKPTQEPATEEPAGETPEEQPC